MRRNTRRRTWASSHVLSSRATKGEGWHPYAEAVQEDLRGAWDGKEDLKHETS